MSSNTNALVTWKRMRWLGFACLLVLPFTLLIGAPDRGLQSEGTTVISPGASQRNDGKPAGLQEAEARFAMGNQKTYYARPSWWPFEHGKGLTIGQVSESELRSPDTIILSGKGSFKRNGNSLNDIPAELRANGPAGNGQKGSDYYIVQLNPTAMRGKSSLEIRALVEGKGSAKIVDYVPNNAWLVRVNGNGRAHFDDTATFQFVEAYHPAFKISPKLGRMPRLDANEAVSDIFSIAMELFPGEDAATVGDDIRRLGGTVIQVHDTGDATLITASLRNNRVVQLARNSAIRFMWEKPEYVSHTLVTSAQIEVGRFLDPREYGNFILPFRGAGVDGGAIVSSGLPNYTNPAPGTALSLAGAVFDVQPQFLGVADNGLTLDAPSFANDNTHPCLTGDCGITAASMAAGVGANHRKVEVYSRGTDVNNDNIVDDATSTGDFLTCDSVNSGGITHGTIVAGAAASNPSGGSMGLGRLYDDKDSIDLFTAFFNDSREDKLEMDGQARGARVIFSDIQITPITVTTCGGNFLSDVDAGTDPSQRLRDMAFRRDLSLANSTEHPRGAKVTLFAFGNPTNFDDEITNGQGNYNLGAHLVDSFLFSNRRVLHVQAVGNDGSVPDAGAADIDPFAPKDANDCLNGCLDSGDIQTNDLATAKNPITVGSTGSDTARASLDPSEFISNYTSKGPATFTSLRGAPLVVAPVTDSDGGFGGRIGRFSDDYGISFATLVSLDNANNTAGPAAVEDVVIQGRTGTSISAGKIAGAALQVRDYFAKGFYPTGAPKVGDRVGDMSGSLVKALLINSTDYASQSLIASCTGRGPLLCPSEQGYGKVELANTLPIFNYRTERRPASLSNIEPRANTPQGLLVVDEFFDGGARGGSALDGSSTGLGVVEVGKSVSFDFYRRHGNDAMRISLAWADATGESVVNDLDLDVVSGDYDITAVGSGICGAAGGGAPELCGNCTYTGSQPEGLASGAYFDPTANNAGVYVWHGNQFREFGGQFVLRGECDGTGALDADLVSFPQNGYDHTNTTESVMLHYFGDALFFGASRSGGDHGFYRVRVNFPDNGSRVAAPNAPAVAAGGDGTLETVPGGDDTVLALASGQSYIGAGPDGISDSTAAVTDKQLIDPTKFGQPFALAVAGPVGNSRISSVIQLNRDIYDCSDRTLSFRVADLSRIPANTNQAETTANVNARTRIEVYEGATLKDVEAGFTTTVDGGSAAFRVGRGSHYNSNARRVQFIGNSREAVASDPIQNNGIVEVKNGWAIRAIYDDQSPTAPGGPTPEDAVVESRVNCVPFLGEVVLFPAGGGASGDPGRRTLVGGGCDEGRNLGGRGDFFFDAGENLTYSVGFANQSPSTPVNVKATLTCLDPIAGGANPCTSLTIAQPTVELGSVPPGREIIAAWTISVDTNVTALATADRSVDFKVTFTSRSTDFGGDLATQAFVFREAIQADLEKIHYRTDFPSGGTIAADYNRDGQIRTVRAGSTARNRELMSFAPLNDVTNPNLDIAGPVGPTAKMPWDFDNNDGGFTAYRMAESKSGPAGSFQNDLGWFYSTAGGCGWQTQNRGVVVPATPGLPKGVWHAGHGPVLGFRVAASCPEYTTPSDVNTPANTEFTRDALQSPIFEKVSPALDARGIPFDVRMEAIGWNTNEELEDTATNVSLEIDSNIDDGGPVLLGTAYSYRIPFGTNGPRTNAANGQRTFGPLRDSDNSLAGKSGSNGEEVGVSEPLVQRKETNIIERGRMPYPVADQDTVARGFQSNTTIDGPTGLPIIQGVCTASICTAGADATLGLACANNAFCTGGGTKVGHTTPWGPVRSQEIDIPAGRFDEFRGSQGNRFQFELSWILGEGGAGAKGWTIDDAYFHWSESHPGDQVSANDCANIPSRVGANPAARQCGTVAFERLTLHNCTTGVKVIVTDTTPAPSGICSAGQVAIVVRSNEEPLGESLCLSPVGGNVFTGIAQVSGVSNQPGVLFVNPTVGDNFNIIASYADPECDQDSDGELLEADFLDVDGDGVRNFGANNTSKDISNIDFLAEGQGSSDDDNCFNSLTLLDIFNPPGVPQRDNNGGGTVSSEDCPLAGFPNGRSPRNGQCDWDDDGFGDLCDNCPTTANNNQLDTDQDGVGNACEVTDIDGDTVPNASDNCPTLHNPSQVVANVGDLRGIYCDSAQDKDDDLVPESTDNCPNETGGLEPPVPAPPIADTYNPDQEDNDADGIGDKCDTEDFDNDLVPNFLDNCATVYNPADPQFQIQTDTDFDGRGDDRAGIDQTPGPQNYCDPDSDDDNRNGVPDDLIAFASELNCNHSSTGISNVQSNPSSVGAIAIAAIALTDDGTADFACTAGDPDQTNNPAIPQTCAQENPGSPNNDASCDTGSAVAVCAGTCTGGATSKLGLACITVEDCDEDIGVCAAVPDGAADPGELSSVRLTLANASIDNTTGAGRTLTNLTVGIRSTTPSVQCTPANTTLIATLPAGGTVLTPVGALSFIVDPANPGPGRSGATKLAEAGFALTAQSDQIEGIAPQQEFKFFIDLDRTDFPRIAPSCPEMPSMNAEGVLCETFDNDRNLSGGFDFTRLTTGQFPGDTLRANGDLTDDVLGFTVDGGDSPTGVDGRQCANYVGRPNCEAPVAEENDWHLHSPYEGPGNGYDPLSLGNGIGAPDGGKAHSGVRSMHMGRHLSPTSTILDTSRYRQVSAFVLDSQGNGDPNPGVVFGPASTLEFWHIIRVHDDESSGDGFLPAGGAFSGGQVQVSLLGSNGKFEKWQRLTPATNGYDSIVNSTISICEFDPGDDELAPANETICRPGSPLWSDIGDFYGSDPTCVSDTDNNDALHKDCGAITSFGVPNNVSLGSIGTGVWARSAFNLSAFAGRAARLRWLFMQGGGWSFGITRSAMEPEPGNPQYQYFEGDDGWLIDDIKLTDLRQLPSVIGPDDTTGLATCSAQGDTANCSSITVNLAGSAAYGAKRVLGLDTLTQAALLDARSSAGSCVNGMMQYQFTEMDSAGITPVDVVAPFSPAGSVSVAPSRDTTYQVDVKCSSDTACAASAQVVVKVYQGQGSDFSQSPLDNVDANEIGLHATGGATTTLQWPSRPQPTGIVGYDVFRLTGAVAGGVDVFTGGTFDGACFANAVPQVALPGLVTTTDSSTPTLNTTYMYQVGHSSANAAAIAPLGVPGCCTGVNTPPGCLYRQDPGDSRCGVLKMAGSTCP